MIYRVLVKTENFSNLSKFTKVPLLVYSWPRYKPEKGRDWGERDSVPSGSPHVGYLHVRWTRNALQVETTASAPCSLIPISLTPLTLSHMTARSRAYYKSYWRIVTRNCVLQPGFFHGSLFVGKIEPNRLPFPVEFIIIFYRFRFHVFPYLLRVFSLGESDHSTKWGHLFAGLDVQAFSTLIAV